MKARLLLPLLLIGFSAFALLADDPKKPNPEATQLLADARDARALWVKFPGFTADIAVTVNGKTQRGSVQVNEKGKVEISDLPEDMAKWTKGVLSSAVSHRLSSGEEPKTQCYFADEDASNPLGREIRMIGDEGSSFRIRDHQIMMVNRTMGDTRFSITMLENKRNEEGKYLPRSYSVHYWDAKTGALKKTESHHQGWSRQQGMDLPEVIRVITVEKVVDAREIALSNIKLH